MDSILQMALHDLVHQAFPSGDGRIKDEERMKLRLKAYRSASTLCRTRLKVYEARELEEMRSDLEEVLEAVEEAESSPTTPTSIEHVIDGDLQ